MMGLEPRPILAASAAVFRGDDVLLVKRGRPPGRGLWSLPGGKVKFGETVRTAALRELREETGVEAEIKGLAGIYEFVTADMHFAIACHACLWCGGEVMAGSDALEAIFIGRDELASFTLAPHTSQAIAAARNILGI
jgi:8-oxo-dGTP diphosphatase